jgi:hypothetical protein
VATKKQDRPRRWPGRTASEDALFRPRVERAWCSRTTAFWLTERANVDVPIPGMAIGDVQGGTKMVGSWEGLALEDADLRAGVVLAVRLERTFHVRIEDGDVHEGHPDQCDEGICLAERVMGE